jgi:hypothetical protein
MFTQVVANKLETVVGIERAALTQRDARSRIELPARGADIKLWFKCGLAHQTTFEIVRWERIGISPARLELSLETDRARHRRTARKLHCVCAYAQLCIV